MHLRCLTQKAGENGFALGTQIIIKHTALKGGKLKVWEEKQQALWEGSRGDTEGFSAPHSYPLGLQATEDMVEYFNDVVNF